MDPNLAAISLTWGQSGRAALREAEVRRHPIEAIDEAITRFRSNLWATERVVLAAGSIAEEPPSARLRART